MTTNNIETEVESEVMPDYKVECEVCGLKPTVAIYENGKLVHHTGMCGACVWGEADCIKPENW